MLRPAPHPTLRRPCQTPVGPLPRWLVRPAHARARPSLPAYSVTTVAPSPPSPRSPGRHSRTRGWPSSIERTASRIAPDHGRGRSSRGRRRHGRRDRGRRRGARAPRRREHRGGRGSRRPCPRHPLTSVLPASPRPRPPSHGRRRQRTPSRPDRARSRRGARSSAASARSAPAGVAWRPATAPRPRRPTAALRRSPERPEVDAEPHPADLEGGSPTLGVDRADRSRPSRRAPRRGPRPARRGSMASIVGGGGPATGIAERRASSRCVARSRRASVSVSRASAPRISATSASIAPIDRSAWRRASARTALPLRPRTPSLLLGLVERRPRLPLGLARARLGLADARPGVADRGQRGLELLLGARQPGARVRDELGGEPEPLGDRERLARAGQADREPVGRRERGDVELDRGVAGLGRVVGVRLELGVVGRRDRRARPARMKWSRSAWASAEPSVGSVPAPSSSRSTSVPSPASPTMRMIVRRWPLNVESDCATDCSSPMSARTSRKTGRRAARRRGDVQARLVHEREQPDRP